MIVNRNNPITEPQPIIIEQIDGELIRSTALRMYGAARPSGLNADEKAPGLI